MFSKEINLTASVVSSLEALKQALVLFYGRELTFTGDFQIIPGKVEKKTLAEMLTRRVLLLGSFQTAHYADGIKVSATIGLQKQNEEWRAVQAELFVGNPNYKQKCLVAHWGDQRFGDDSGTVRVAEHTSEVSSYDHWLVGHNLSDRRSEAFYPKPASNS